MTPLVPRGLPSYRAARASIGAAWTWRAATMTPASAPRSWRLPPGHPRPRPPFLPGAATGRKETVTAACDGRGRGPSYRDGGTGGNGRSRRHRPIPLRAGAVRLAPATPRALDQVPILPAEVVDRRGRLLLDGALTRDLVEFDAHRVDGDGAEVRRGRRRQRRRTPALSPRIRRGVRTTRDRSVGRAAWRATRRWRPCARRGRASARLRASRG